MALVTLRRFLAAPGIALLIAVGVAHGDGSLIKDGSFESLTPSRTWSISFAGPENEEATRVDFLAGDQSYRGQRTLHIESVGQQRGYAIVSQSITFPKPYPTVLYVSGAVNADVDEYTKLYAHAGVDGQEQPVHLSSATNFQRTYGWRREYVKWTCEGNPIQRIRFMVIFCGKGWASWDDLALTSEPQEPDPLAAETPWVSIPQIAQSPSNPHDWQAAQTLSNFTLLGVKKFAEAQTRVRLAHTADAIYVRAECDERLLDPVYNAVHTFQANVTGRDAYVFNDDCVELFFDPDGTRSAFTQLAVNSLGTQWDAQDGKRAWNGTWQAKAGKDQSSWWCELEIPLQDLGLSAAQERVGTFNVARERKPVTELSSYSPLNFEFGEPIRFATLRLGPSAPVVEVKWKSHGESLQGVEYEIYNPTGKTQPLLYGLGQGDGEGHTGAMLRHVTIQPGETKTVAIEIPQRDDLPWIRSRGFVRCRDDGRYLLITPWFQTKPSGIVASVMLEATSDFAATYNSHPLSLTQTDGNLWTGKIRIAEGRNSFGIELKEPGQWRCRIWDDKTTLNVVSGAAWMTPTAEPSPSWTQKTFLPLSAEWVHATAASAPAADATWAGAQWVEGAAGSKFLRQIRYGMTRYVPEYDRPVRYPFYEKYGQIAKVYTLNPGPNTQPDYEMVIETSPAVKLNSPVGRLNYKQRTFVPNKMIRTKLADGWERNTILFTSYLWPSKDKKTLADSVSGVTTYGLPLLVRPTGPGPAALRIYGQAYNGFITEVPRLVDYERQPFPEGGRVPEFEIYMWGNLYFDHAESDWPLLLDMYEAAGVHTYILGHLGGGDPMVTPPEHWRWSTGNGDGYSQLKRFVSYAKSRGFRIAANIFWPIDQPDWLEDHPEDGAVYEGMSGEKHTVRVPMSLILDKKHGVYKHWRERLTACLRDIPLDEVLWDWETSPFLGSYDERTLAEFRQYAKLPQDTKLGEEIIKQSEALRNKWIAFRCAQVVQVAASMREIIKDVSPDTAFSFYSGYPHYSTERYSTDWESLAKVVDIAFAGYQALWGGNARILADIMQAEGKPSIPGLEIYAKGHRAEMLGVKLSQALIEGGRGAMIFASGCSNMNLTALASVARVTRFLPQLKPFLLNLDRQDQLVEAKVRAAVLRHGDRYLIVLQNHSNDAIDCALGWKGPAVRSFRVLGQSGQEARAPKTLTLQPFSVTWIILECSG